MDYRRVTDIAARMREIDLAQQEILSTLPDEAQDAYTALVLERAALQAEIADIAGTGSRI